MVKARSQVGQTCFFLGAGVAAGVEGDVECEGDSCGEEEAESGRYEEFEN